MEETIVELSHKHRLGHLGSCLTMVPILDHIYSVKKSRDVVILSAGHAGIALYAALEKYEGRDAEKLVETHGVHPFRDVENGIHVSSGSLGSAVLVAAGYALADPTRDVYVILSDGECAEGSVWEALAFAYNKNLKNLKVHVNVNGYSAYDPVNTWYLWLRLKAFYWRTQIWFTSPPNLPFLKGLKAHYHVMSDEDKDNILKDIRHEKTIWSDVAQGDVSELSTLFNHWRSWVWNP